MRVFKVGDHVIKHSGGYGGPGVIRGVIATGEGDLRYIVAHNGPRSSYQ
jgi:hypothetical protein